MLKDHALSMLTEAVQDGGQAMRDPVGGSVEFHFVPILKLISTLLIMGVFDDSDVKHILKLIEPSVFTDGESRAEDPEASKSGDAEKQLACKEEGTEVKEVEEQEGDNRGELMDEGVGDEEQEEDEELEPEEEEEYEEEAGKGEEDEHAAEKTDQEKAADKEGEKEAGGAEAEVKEEEDVGEGLLHMKLPESVKLQVK